jgi:hypothetical protein
VLCDAYATQTATSSEPEKALKNMPESPRRAPRALFKTQRFYTLENPQAVDCMDWEGSRLKNGFQTLKSLLMPCIQINS